MSNNEPLTISTMLAIAEQEFGRSGFNVSRDSGIGEFPPGSSILAEDAFSVVALLAFETWADLDASWADAQAALVALLSNKLARSAPKAWDGYLVLLCASVAPSKEQVSAIERDTTRVRKIVATADDLLTRRDLVQLLDPFKPLEIAEADDLAVDVLSLLPDELSGSVPRWATEAVIEAYREAALPLERLHKARLDHAS